MRQFQMQTVSEAALLVGRTWKIINFNCKEISDRLELSQPAFTIPSQLGKRASTLP